MEQTSDQELLRLVAKGNGHAFRLLYRRYRGPIYSYLLRRLGSSALAEDVCQEVFMGLAKAAPAWKPKAAVSTWLYRIAHNQACKAKRRPEPVSTDKEGIDHSEPEEQAAQGERAALVRAAISNLDEDHQAVLVLQYYHGLSYSEVAEVLEIPIGTVRSRISRAKLTLVKALRDQLAPERGAA